MRLGHAWSVLWLYLLYALGLVSLIGFGGFLYYSKQREALLAAAALVGCVIAAAGGVMTWSAMSGQGEEDLSVYLRDRMLQIEDIEQAAYKRDGAYLDETGVGNADLKLSDEILEDPRFEDFFLSVGDGGKSMVAAIGTEEVSFFLSLQQGEVMERACKGESSVCLDGEWE